MAPEVLASKKYTETADVYSFGIVLWECLTRRLPWQNVEGARSLIVSVMRGERPIIPPSAPADLAALTEACWVHDLTARHTLECVLTDLGEPRVTAVSIPPAGTLTRTRRSTTSPPVTIGKAEDYRRRC